MKVLLVNGSPNKKGCINTALSIIQESLIKEGIESDIFWIKNKPLTGCLGCGYCAKAGKCRYDDRVNEFLETAKEYDGFIFGVPVHFASAAASMSAFMDRAFFVDHCANLLTFELKPGAVIMQYTGLSEITKREPPTYACVGTNDGIASYRSMKSYISRIKKNGTDAEIQVFKGLTHGFGLGEGTVAEGWIDEAVQFWEKQMK